MSEYIQLVDFPDRDDQQKYSPCYEYTIATEHEDSDVDVLRDVEILRKKKRHRRSRSHRHHLRYKKERESSVIFRKLWKKQVNFHLPWRAER